MRFPLTYSRNSSHASVTAPCLQCVISLSPSSVFLFGIPRSENALLDKYIIARKRFDCNTENPFFKLSIDKRGVPCYNEKKLCAPTDIDVADLQKSLLENGIPSL
jgi:hypothetical protein